MLKKFIKQKKNLILYQLTFNSGKISWLGVDATDQDSFGLDAEEGLSVVVVVPSESEAVFIRFSLQDGNKPFLSL